MHTLEYITPISGLKDILVSQLDLSEFDRVELERDINTGVDVLKVLAKHLFDHRKDNQYLIVYFGELAEEQIMQFDEPQRTLVLQYVNMGLWSYRLWYSEKSTDILCKIVDIMNSIIRKNVWEKTAFVLEDFDGNLFPFEQFVIKWNERKGFFFK